MVLILFTVFFQAADWSAFKTLDDGRATVLSFSRQGSRTLLGRETNVQVSWTLDGAYENAGLEDHRVTALLSTESEIWAGTVSVYNLTIPVVLKTTWTDLPYWEQVGVLPDGVGNIRELFQWNSRLFFKTAHQLFYFENDQVLELSPPDGVFVDACASQTELHILVSDESGGKIYSTMDFQTWDLVSVLDGPDPAALVLSGDDIWVGFRDGTVVHVNSGVISQTEMGDLNDMIGNGQYLLLSHDLGRLSFINSKMESVSILSAPYDVMQAPLLFQDEDQFFVSCVANKRFVPVSCVGFLQWYPLGKLDLNSDGEISTLDEVWVRNHWSESLPDWDGDGEVGAYEWAVVLSHMPQNESGGKVRKETGKTTEKGDR